MAASKILKDSLAKLRDGDITFTQFSRVTGRDWNALAIYLMGRWSTPSAVSIEDVVQELMLGCWRVLPNWDPAHPKQVPLERYCVFHAVASAKGWMHKQRSAGHDTDRGASRHPVPLSSLSEKETRVAFASPAFTEQADQDVFAERSQAVSRALGRCRTQRDTLCVLALCETGSIEGAIEMLYGDPHTRRICRFNSERDVRRAIRRAVTRVAPVETIAA